MEPILRRVHPRDVDDYAEGLGLPRLSEVVEAFLLRERARHRLLRGTSLVTADELSRSTER